MKIEIVSSAAGDRREQYLSTYLVNETVAIDAGCLGLLPPSRQQGVGHVFLSHSHIDHIATLPLFLDTVFTPGGSCPRVYGSAATLQALRSDVLNNRIWPDFLELSTPDRQFVELTEIAPGEVVDAGEVTLAGLLLDHVVPTLGFTISDGESTVAMISDTLACDTVRDVLHRPLNGVFLECSFPNSLAGLAGISKHLTPRGFGELVQPLSTDVPVIATHIKATHYDETVAELQSLGLLNLTIGEPGKAYEF